MKVPRVEEGPTKKISKNIKSSKPVPAKSAIVENVPRKRKLSGDLELTEIQSRLPEESESSDLCNDRTIYVEGLPFGATDEDIKTFFSPCGTIKQMRLAKWHDTGRLRGYGHVEFMKEEQANKALELSGKYLQNRYVKIEKPNAPKISAPINSDKSAADVVINAPAGCNTIFIKNLPYDVNEEEVEAFFKVFGPIVSVRLARWGHTNQLKGFGYVCFKRPDSAEIAVKKSKVGNEVSLKGRAILCDFETGAPKLSFQRQVAKQKHSA